MKAAGASLYGALLRAASCEGPTHTRAFTPINSHYYTKKVSVKRTLPHNRDYSYLVYVGRNWDFFIRCYSYKYNVSIVGRQVWPLASVEDNANQSLSTIDVNFTVIGSFIKYDLYDED